MVKIQEKLWQQGLSLQGAWVELQMTLHSLLQNNQIKFHSAYK